MTHGDKSKAKTVKASKASGRKEASSRGEKVREAGAEKGNGKTGEKAAASLPKTAKSKAGGQKGGAEKSSSEKSGSKAAVPLPASGETKVRASAKAEKSRGTANGEPGTFSDPLIANAFSRAVEKYGNAFRKLTD